MAWFEINAIAFLPAAKLKEFPISVIVVFFLGLWTNKIWLVVVVNPEFITKCNPCVKMFLKSTYVYFLLKRPPDPLGRQWKGYKFRDIISYLVIWRNPALIEFETSPMNIRWIIMLTQWLASERFQFYWRHIADSIIYVDPFELFCKVESWKGFCGLPKCILTKSLQVLRNQFQ